MRRKREFWFREREDGTFGDVYWTNLGGKRVSTDQKTLKDAKRWKERKLTERADPRRAAAETATLADAMREMYAELRRRGRSIGTQTRCRQKLAHFPRLWGEDCKLADIDARKIGQYIDDRLEDSYETTGFKTPKRITLRDELAFLRQLLKLARRQGLYSYAIDDVLPEQFETGHKPKKDWVREENLPRLLDHVEPRHAAHLLFFVCTSGRLADSYRARREDFNLETWRATVRGSKTEGSYRTIPISDFLHAYVERMLRDAEGDDVLFVDWPNLHRDLKAACDRAKIPRVTTNGLRRTFGMWHRIRGQSLDTISKLFGHTTAKLVRDVYADIDGDELAELMALEQSKATYKSGTGGGIAQ
jgi:integrase